MLQFSSVFIGQICSICSSLQPAPLTTSALGSVLHSGRAIPTCIGGFFCKILASDCRYNTPSSTNKKLLRPNLSTGSLAIDVNTEKATSVLPTLWIVSTLPVTSLPLTSNKTWVSPTSLCGKNLVPYRSRFSAITPFCSLIVFGATFGTTPSKTIKCIMTLLYRLTVRLSDTQ